VDLDAEVTRLRAEAARLRAESDAAMDRGDAAAAVELIRRAAAREQAADLMVSTSRQQSVTKRGMVSAARAHISAGKSASVNEGKADALVLAASEKGHTMRSLATLTKQKTGRETPASIISRARKGTRPIRRSAARVIEEATGFRAIPANWPGGWASED
jgi:hypothetical protein